MLKLNLCRGISRKFFYEANGLALSAAMLLFFSCNDEIPNSNEPEPEDVSVKEYAFINPDDTLNISLCEAEDIATLFMDELGEIDNTFKSAGMHHNSRKTFVIPDDNLEPAVYAINLDPDGFCIVAATKKTETILAYSDQGKFDPDNLPLGVADWLCEKIEVIQDVRNDASISVEKPSNSQNKLKPQSSNRIDDASGNYRTVTTTYGPLLKTTWGQGYPYNFYCPIKCDNGDHAAAGCVAIAAAQIVKYWEPQMFYNFYPFSWKDMPNRAWGAESIEYISKNNGYISMAYLISEIGNQLNMDYGCKESGAKTSDIPEVLSRKYEFYSCGNYQEMTNSKAQSKIIDNIKNKQPVIMNGKSEKKWLGLYYSGGHAWVCDGYKEIKHIYSLGGSIYYDHLFHMNWGWDGKYNGWYTIGLDFVEGDYNFTGNDGKYVYKRGYITDIKASKYGK